MRLFCWITHFVHAEGLENIPKEGGYLICANHRGMADPLCVACYLPECPFFMAKEELFHVPLLRRIIRYAHAFPVKRGTSDIASVQESVKILREGKNLLVFPEGTRSKTGAPGEPKPGVAMLAARSGCDVLPCAVCYKGKAGVFRKMTVRFGPVIHNEELNLKEGRRSEAYTRGANRIMDAIVSMLPEVNGKKVRAPRHIHRLGRLARKAGKTEQTGEEVR